VSARFVAIVGILAASGAILTAAQTPALPTDVSAARTPLSPRNASYTIYAALDPTSRTITGNEQLTWRNISAVPAPTLRFHLYYNAWRNTRSSWMRERLMSGSRGIASRPQPDWSWIDITSLRLGGAAGQDLTSRLRFIAPDDGNADDRTVIEVPLDTPVAPGQTIDVQVAWTSHVPRTFARTGAIDNYFFVAQWFPKIGVLEDTGWNCHQFHSATEFFSDFGSYDVHITAPRGWIVGATGVEQERHDEGGVTSHRFRQDDVHDFAWTTSPNYVELTDTFTHPTLPPVQMRLLLQPEHAGQAARHFDATRAALRYYGEWYGPYPYGHITIVDPAWESGAGGMEYPTLFTAGSRWLAPAGATTPEGVTIHEAGHQFWYGIVATNEFENAWMDEGLNTFSTARVIDQVYRPNFYSQRYFGGFVPWVFKDIPLNRETDGNRLGPYRAAATADAQSTPTWRFWPGTASAITYSKTALWLNTLERMIGWTTLQRIMSTYFTRWAFKHPKPDDFFAIANEISGRDLTWYFDEVYRGSPVFDYSLDVLRSEPATARGYFGDGSQRAYAASQGDPKRYRTLVVARRLGDGIFGVDVRVVFDNNEEVRWHWDGRERWKAFDIEKPVRAAYAQVDPDHVLLLDVNYSNNSISLAPRAHAAARKWSLAWMIWLQDHLLTYGFFV
jgi:hypothetical protein